MGGGEDSRGDDDGPEIAWPIEPETAGSRTAAMEPSGPVEQVGLRVFAPRGH